MKQIIKELKDGLVIERDELADDRVLSGIFSNMINETVLKSNMALIRRLTSAGKTDEAKLVREYVKTWLEIAYFAKARK